MARGCSAWSAGGTTPVDRSQDNSLAHSAAVLTTFKGRIDPDLGGQTNVILAIAVM